MSKHTLERRQCILNVYIAIEMARASAAKVSFLQDFVWPFVDEYIAQYVNVICIQLLKTDLAINPLLMWKTIHFEFHFDLLLFEL